MTDYYVDSSATGGGSGTTTGDPFDLSEMWSQISSQASGNVFNVKAGTYILDAAYLPFAAGSTTAPAIIRGYTTTPNDLIAKPTTSLTAGTDYPLFKATTASQYAGINGSYWHIENMGFESTANRPAWYLRTAISSYLNCSFLASYSGSNVAAISSYGSRNHFVGCWFESTNASSTQNNVSVSSHNDFYGCVFKCATTGANINLAGYGGVHQSVIIGGLVGFQQSYAGALGMVCGNTFYNCTTGVRYRNDNDKYLCSNNLFHSCTTGIDFFSSTTSFAPIVNNSFYNCTTNIDPHNSLMPALATIVESSDPLVNAGTDFALVDGAASVASGYPYIYPLIAQQQFLDVGGVQKQSSGSSGGSSTFHPLAQ
jgi:hypothetical protein